MPRMYSYYGNRLQQQTNSRNMYNNNVNGQRLIGNPQTSNYNSSNFNTYHIGAQTTYTKGIGNNVIDEEKYIISSGGIVNIISPSIPIVCPSRIINGGTFTTNGQLEGLRGYTVIQGDLIITQFTEQPDFSILDCLITINGTLRIYNNTLKTIKCNVITTNIYIANNPGLTAIQFQAMTTGNIDIQYSNGTIQFPSMTSGNVNIVNNTINVIEFPSLVSTYDFRIYSNSIVYIGCPVLISAIYFIIYNNPNLTTIYFPLLTNIGTMSEISSFGITDYEWIESAVDQSFTNMDHVEMFNSQIDAFNNHISPFRQITVSQIGIFSIYNNSALTSIRFESITLMYGTVEIISNNALITIEFPKIITIITLYINSNMVLTNIYFPSQIHYGRINIQNNDQLLTVNYPNITTCGNIYIIDNYNLQTVSGFLNLISCMNVIIRNSITTNTCKNTYDVLYIARGQNTFTVTGTNNPC